MLEIFLKLLHHIPLLEKDELAVDWLNGRRTPDANQELKAAIVGLNLASDAPRVYRALVESTCFGARSIVERFIENGVPVKGLIGLEGSHVNRHLPCRCWLMSSICRYKIHRSEQTCAVGAGMFAATVAGIYTCRRCHAGHGKRLRWEYIPNPEKAAIYSKRYARFKKLGKFIRIRKSSHITSQTL